MDRNLNMYEEMPRVGRTFMYDDVLFSRDHLGVDCIDLYLMHRDNPKVPVAEIMDTFEEFLRKGWIKAYGMSNWRLDRFAEAYEYCERMGYQGPSVYSPFFSLVKLEKPWYYRIPAFKEAWLPWFEEHRDVTIAAWSAQGRGFFGNYPQFQPENADPATRMAVFDRGELCPKRAGLSSGGRKRESAPPRSPCCMSSAKRPILRQLSVPRSKQDIDNVIRATSVRLTQEEIDYLTLKRDTL